jgi:transcriptional regulator with XRE-family HTH domain
MNGQVGIMKKNISIEKLGELVRKRRVHMGYSQEKLEELTGINRQMIGRIELSKHIPSVSQLNQLMSTLDLGFDEITEEEKPNVFVAMMGEAKSEKEQQGFERMISMMLCLRKYERLKRVYHV